MAISEHWLELARQQADRFWSKVDKSESCWIWTAGRGQDGYGKFQINEKGWRNGRPVQKHVRAHKLAWEMQNGPLPDHLVILHACDNPPCCNPAHLSAGTQGDNRADCTAKGRNAHGERHGSKTKPERVMRGASHYKAKIDEGTVTKIRAMTDDGVGPSEIAAELGLTVSIVTGVRYGRSWKSAAKFEDDRARPFIKWAGGKHDMLEEFRQLMPVKFSRYIEPFLGGGAVFFDVSQRFSVPSLLSDANGDLVITYQALKRDVDAVILRLRELTDGPSSKTVFLERRELFNARSGNPSERAALFIYMNKMCFNGLYRVNSSGEFNVGWNRRTHDGVLNEQILRKCSAALQSSTIERCDWRDTIASAQPGDFLYIDSPYHPASDTADFTGYTVDGFTLQDQRDLAAAFRALTRSGVQCMLSNSDTPLVRDLYAGFDITEVTRGGRMNCKGDRRGRVTELVIRGGYTT